MKTDNELIAEFMGMTPNPHDKGLTWTTDPHYEDNQVYGHWCILKYDTSWDWLMPVVEKISSLYEAEAHDIEEFCAVINTTINTPISEVYSEVVEFIKWYNKNNQ